MIRQLSIGIAAVLFLLCWKDFHPLLALWLIGLAGLTYRNPPAGVSLLLVILPIDLVRPLFSTVYVSYSELELTACICALLARRGTMREMDWGAVRWGIPWLSAVALSGLANIEWYKTAPHCLRQFELMAACFLAVNAYSNLKRRKDLSWVLAGAGILHLAIGLTQAGEVMEGRPLAVFTNLNQFAGYIGLLFPFFLIFSFERQDWRIRLFFFYLSALCLIGQSIVASRGALAGAVGVGAYLWAACYGRRLCTALRNPLKAARAWARRLGPIVALHLAAVGLIAVILVSTQALSGPLYWISYNLGLSSGLSLEESFEHSRLPIWRIGLAIWREHPILGVGPGRWEEAVRALSNDPRQLSRFPEGALDYALIHSHSLPIQLGAVFGLLGLLAFLSWFAWAGLQIRLSDRPWKLAGYGLLLGYSIHNLLDVTFPSLSPETGLLIGMVISARNEGSR